MLVVVVKKTTLAANRGVSGNNRRARGKGRER